MIGLTLSSSKFRPICLINGHALPISMTFMLSTSFNYLSCLFFSILSFIRYYLRNKSVEDSVFGYGLQATSWIGRLTSIDGQDHSWLFRNVICLFNLRKRNTCRICSTICFNPFLLRSFMTINFRRSRLVDPFNRSRINIVLAGRSAMFHSQDGRAMQLVRAFNRRIIGRCASMDFVTSRRRQLTTITIRIYISAYGSALSTNFFMSNYSIRLSNGRRIFRRLQFRYVLRLYQIRMIMFSNVSQAMRRRILRTEGLLRHLRLSIRQR